MKLRLAAGSRVLNQNPADPMDGTVTGWNGPLVTVRWANGESYDEQPSDVTLTGEAHWEPVPD
jgi:hypothetical protein